ncbi:hypothetical protein MACH16_15320 [Marinomonas pontica]|uniref:MOSC domain-containing protein n=1 Tax=Marinomonas pontica TaxID=264739 RepID=A0ABN6WLR3_9GAMM|nr:hypothetical protein MACH16_15320 [Marinomonas pontica]
MPYSLSELTIYPIKSIQGISLQSSEVDFSGLLGDRRYMLVNQNNQFISGREHPNITLITARSLGNNQWLLSHPKMANKVVLHADTFPAEFLSVQVWDDVLQGQRTQNDIDTWLSEIAAEPVKLIYFGTTSQRYTSRRPETPVAFADGYPFLLTTQASLDDLNKTATRTIEMAQFRPNLVIEGNQAFEEDRWKRIKIGEVEFENVKPCVRCIFTTLNPKTAERIGKGEPLKTLGKFRLLGKEGVTFGVNMIALNKGRISTGDTVEILEYHEAETYLDRR